MRKQPFVRVISLILLLSALFLAGMGPAGHAAQPQATATPATATQAATTMWIGPLDFLPGDPSVQTSFNAVSSGVGGGLSGLIITSTALGSTTAVGGNKVIEKGVQVPPGYNIASVRICYELSNPRSYISQIRLAQVQNPPSRAFVLLDDARPFNAVGPVCVDSQPTNVDPSQGQVLLSLRVHTADPADRIVLRAVGLNLVKQVSGTVMWINPLALQAGDPSVQTSFNAVSSGVGGGLSGLIITSTAMGSTTASGGNKVVETGLSVPPGYLIKAVRVCYELSNPRSYISQIRLAQVQNPPSSAFVRLDDGTPLNAVGPACVDSRPTNVDPSQGQVLLSLRLYTGDPADRIVVRGLGLVLASA